MQIWRTTRAARDELREVEASQASNLFTKHVFSNASLALVKVLAKFLLCLQVVVSLSVTRKGLNRQQERKCRFLRFQNHPKEENSGFTRSAEMKENSGRSHPIQKYVHALQTRGSQDIFKRPTIYCRTQCAFTVCLVCSFSNKKKSTY